MRYLGKLTAVIVATLFLVQYGIAADSGFYLTAQGSSSKIDIDDSVTFTAADESARIYGVYGAAGFQLDSNFVIEVGGGYAENFDTVGLFDDFELSEYRATVGWAIPIGNRFQLVPKVGLYRWRFEAEEGVFLNPGPELKKTLTNTEGHWQVDGEVKLLDWLALDFSYFYSDTTFGEVRSYRAGVQFAF